MKKAHLILLFAILIFSQKGTTQITQLEFASGISKTDFTSFSSNPLNEKKTFSIATLAFFQKYHKKEDFIFDELGVQNTIFWNFSKWASIGPSLYYNSVAGFSERVSLQLTSKTNKFTFISTSSVTHSEKTKTINGELFLQMQFIQPLRNDWNALLSTVILTTWDKFSIHARSFQQVRAGFSYNTTQFGLAADFDQYGSQPLTKTSIGIFIRKIFLTI